MWSGYACSGHTLLPNCYADTEESLVGADLRDAKLSRPRRHVILLWPTRSLTSCEQPAMPAVSREHVWQVDACDQSLTAPLRGLARSCAGDLCCTRRRRRATHIITAARILHAMHDRREGHLVQDKSSV